jgi:hypothetical protein
MEEQLLAELSELSDSDEELYESLLKDYGCKTCGSVSLMRPGCFGVAVEAKVLRDRFD